MCADAPNAIVIVIYFYINSHFSMEFHIIRRIAYKYVQIILTDDLVRYNFGTQICAR